VRGKTAEFRHSGLGARVLLAPLNTLFERFAPASAPGCGPFAAAGAASAVARQPTRQTGSRYTSASGAALLAQKIKKYWESCGFGNVKLDSFFGCRLSGKVVINGISARPAG
jgi:hypothetical protein